MIILAKRAHLNTLFIIKYVDSSVALWIDIILIPSTIDDLLPVLGRVFLYVIDPRRHRFHHHFTAGGASQLLGQGKACAGGSSEEALAVTVIMQCRR